jgi:hypothetical protein
MLRTKTLQLSFEDPVTLRATKDIRSAHVTVDTARGLRIPTLTVVYAAKEDLTPYEESQLCRYEIRGYMDKMPVDPGSQLLGSCTDIVGERWVFMMREYHCHV